MDPITMALLGGAIGGLTSKKPLQGALLGAAGGAAGGALLGGGASGGGLLGQTGTAAGAGVEAMPAFNPITNSWQNAPVGGLLGSLKEMAPMAQAAGTGIQTAQSMMPQQQPVMPAQLRGGAFDASGLLAQSNQQLQALQQKRMMRRGMA